MGHATLIIHRLAPARRAVRLDRVLACSVAVVAVTLLALVSNESSKPPAPLALAVREGDGQLFIAWSRQAADGARLEIVDGANRAAQFDVKGLTSVTYMPHTADVKVRLARDTDAHTEIARFLVRESSSASEVNAQMARLSADARALGAKVRRETQRVDQMQKAADRMLARVSAPPPPRRADSKPVTTRWWR